MPYFFKNLDHPFNLLDEQAFEANQRGEFTAAQQKQLTSASGWDSIIMLAIIIGNIIIVPVILRGMFSNNLFYVIGFSVLFMSALLVFGYSVLSQVIESFKMRQDINNSAIHQGQGQLVHDKQGYTFNMNGSTLRLYNNLANGLSPETTYQIYYLERSRLLLSARTAFQANPAQAQDAINDILAAANGFSPNDVLTNQNGEVTFAQISKLIPNVLVGVGIILGYILFMFLIIMTMTSPNNKTLAFGLLFIFGIVVIVSISSLIPAIKSLLDLVSPNLRPLQGQVYKEKRVVGGGRNRYDEYSYIISGQRFVVNYRAYTALIDGLQYRIYYLARSKKLIAIEALYAQATSNLF